MKPFLLFLPRAFWPLILGLLAALLLHFGIAPHLGGFASDLLINAGIAIILAVSLTVVNGFTGQFSIGHAGFMSVGGYLAVSIVYYASVRIFHSPDFHGGLLSSPYPAFANTPICSTGDLLFVGAILAGAILAGAVGWIVGLPSLRLRGDYLAIVTLGFGEIVRVIIQGSPDQLDSFSNPLLSTIPFPEQLLHLGGALGFTGAPAYTSVFWVWTAVAITLAATIRLKHSSYGRALLSIREDEIAARASGVNTTRFKVRAFVFSSFFAGLAGGLYAMKIGSINAGELGFLKSFDIIIMVVLGGLGSVSGAALAAVLLTLLPELLRSPPSLFPYGLIAAVIIAILIFLLAPRKKNPFLVLVSVCAGWELLRFSAHLLSINLADYRMVIYALALILMMILRPQGLFGLHEVWDYLPESWLFWMRWRTEPRRGPEARMDSRNSDSTRPLLEARNLSLSFGGLRAVQDFSLSLPPLGLHGIIGPNGAGKTTAFNLLTGVYCPQAGSIVLDNHSIAGNKPHLIARSGLSRTFQNIRLFPDLSVLDNVRIAAQLRHPFGIVSTVLRNNRYMKSEQAILSNSRRLLEIFNLSARQHELARNLPYGDQRRLEIARALATSPKVLLLDEPAAGMNPQEKIELMNLIRFIRDHFQIAILLIEHDMKLVMSICENLTVLDHGETIAVGTPSEIQCNHKVIEAYLGEAVT